MGLDTRRRNEHASVEQFACRYLSGVFLKHTRQRRGGKHRQADEQRGEVETSGGGGTQIKGGSRHKKKQKENEKKNDSKKRQERKNSSAQDKNMKSKCYKSTKILKT